LFAKGRTYGEKGIKVAKKQGKKPDYKPDCFLKTVGIFYEKGKKKETKGQKTKAQKRTNIRFLFTKCSKYVIIKL
jgi:hypothetical protein